MKTIKNLLFGFLIGGVLGLAAGVNIGRNQPILSNPFNDQSVQGRLKNTGNAILREGGEAIEDAGKAFKDQFN